MAWWEDPACYIGCAHCGAYLADLPRAYPWIWDPEVIEDLEEDPNGSNVNPLEFD